MSKINCWEFQDCGREPGGHAVKSLGICPAAMEVTADGINKGKNGGRICWAVTGTFCTGEVQGTFAQKQVTCMACKFFQRVQDEEGSAFRVMPLGG